MINFSRGKQCCGSSYVPVPGMMNYDQNDLFDAKNPWNWRNFMSLGTVVIKIRPLWSAT